MKTIVHALALVAATTLTILHIHTAQPSHAAQQAQNSWLEHIRQNLTYTDPHQVSTAQPCAQDVADKAHVEISQADIAWLQQTNQRLTNQDNHRLNIMKHFARDIAKKIAQKPELVTTPFVRSNSNNNRHHRYTHISLAPLPTSQTTLFLVAIEEATACKTLIPVIDALLEGGIDPFQSFDLPHANGQDRVQDSYFNTLVRLTTVDRHPTEASINALIHVLNYGLQKTDRLEEYERCKKAFYQLPNIPEDHKTVLQEFLSGTRQELSLTRRLIHALKTPDATGATLLDKVVQKSETTTPPGLYSLEHENARHQLQTYLLQHNAPLKQQTSLHSQYTRNAAVQATYGMLRDTCPLWALPYSTIVTMGSGIAIWIGLCMQLESSTVAETWDTWTLVARFIKELAIGEFPITKATLITFKLGMLASFLGSFVVLSQPRNIISEHVRAWRNGITDMWGRKKEIPERYADEVGGLE